MGKGARTRRDRIRRTHTPKPPTAREVMAQIAEHRFTRPPWEAYRLAGQRSTPEDREKVLLVMALTPFNVREYQHGTKPSGSSSLGSLAERSGLSVPATVEFLEELAGAGSIQWVQATGTLFMNVLVPV